MKKIAMVLMVLTLLLAACGPDSTNPGNPSPGVSGGKGVWDNSKWDETTWQ